MRHSGVPGHRLVGRAGVALAAIVMGGCALDRGATGLGPDEDGALSGALAEHEMAGRLIYTVNEAGGSRAMSIRPDGTDPRPLFARQPWQWVVSLTYSPERDRIAFHGGGDLHVARANGAAPVRLEAQAEPIDRPRWSPDGRHVLGTQFPKSGAGGPGTVWVFAADGSETLRLPATTTDHATWAGNRLINVQRPNGEGWATVRFDGSPVGTLSNEAHIAHRQRLEDSSPDGSIRAWVSPRSGLYVVSGSGDRLLYAREGLSYRMRWSPDGQRIAVLADCDASMLRPGKLIVVALRDGSARTVADNVFCRGDFDW